MSRVRQLESLRGGSCGFIVPDLAGPVTGGTLYNAQLIAALERAGVRCIHGSADDEAFFDRQGAARYWIDSLYLPAWSRLRARLAPARIGLLVHYLPSLVAHGREVSAQELDPSEVAALTEADAALVTSPFMQRQLERLGFSGPVLCVAPGVTLPASQVRGAGPRPRIAMLCNLVPAKGVLPFLDALGPAIRPSDTFLVTIVGGLDRDAAYAALCRARIEGHPALRGRVRLCGPQPHAQALSMLADSDLFVSASRMESYGMALAEARALGVPVLCRAGGNAGAHVDPMAGGRLADDDQQLADALLELVRDPVELAAREGAARRAAQARSWDHAAAEFIEAVMASGKSSSA
jgi:glycosyltransferase involved in cell wall biosynthesis